MAPYDGTQQWHHVHCTLQWHPGATSNPPKWFVALPPIGSKNRYSYRYLGIISKKKNLWNVQWFLISNHPLFYGLWYGVDSERIGTKPISFLVAKAVSSECMAAWSIRIPRNSKWWITGCSSPMSQLGKKKQDYNTYSSTTCLYIYIYICIYIYMITYLFGGRHAQTSLLHGFFLRPTKCSGDRFTMKSFHHQNETLQSNWPNKKIPKNLGTKMTSWKIA